MISYYQRFVPNFATIAGPLFNLLQKETSFFWSSACQDSFTKLKGLLTKAPILAFPNFNKEFIIQTDASLNTIGAVLSQLDKDSYDHPVSYYSCTLQPAEKN